MRPRTRTGTKPPIPLVHKFRCKQTCPDLDCREARARVEGQLRAIDSRRLAWKPADGGIKSTVFVKGDYMGFHVSLGECS